MKVGYMRVSRRDQNPDLQRRALEAAGSPTPTTRRKRARAARRQRRSAGSCGRATGARWDVLGAARAGELRG